MSFDLWMAGGGLSFWRFSHFFERDRDMPLVIDLTDRFELF